MENVSFKFFSNLSNFFWQTFTEKKKERWKKKLFYFPCIFQVFSQNLRHVSSLKGPNCCAIPLWSCWQRGCHWIEHMAAVREGKTNGVALPPPLHLSESCCRNTPVSWRNCDCAWLMFRIHSGESFSAWSLCLWTCSKFRSEFKLWECWDVLFSSQLMSGDARGWIAL